MLKIFIYKLFKKFYRDFLLAILDLLVARSGGEGPTLIMYTKSIEKHLRPREESHSCKRSLVLDFASFGLFCK
jgi:hypothetical protein